MYLIFLCPCPTLVNNSHCPLVWKANWPNKSRIIHSLFKIPSVSHSSPSLPHLRSFLLLLLLLLRRWRRWLGRPRRPRPDRRSGSTPTASGEWPKKLKQASSSLCFRCFTWLGQQQSMSSLVLQLRQKWLWKILSFWTTFSSKMMAMHHVLFLSRGQELSVTSEAVRHQEE